MGLAAAYTETLNPEHVVNDSAVTTVIIGVADR
jgi:hypothetical protein